MWCCFLHRGYYIRWKAVDHCVKQFLCVTDACDRRQVGLNTHDTQISIAQYVNTWKDHSVICRSVWL